MDFLQDGIFNNITEFILLGFPVFQPWHWGLFGITLVMYLLTLLGNITIIVLVWTDRHLHSPMYFFISNFSFIEILYTTVTIPKMLPVIIGNYKSISFLGCITQFHFFFFLGSTECYLLAVMSYDRYCAICNPLHYKLLMNVTVCCNLVMVCWIVGFCPVFAATCAIANLNFCGTNIQHFFCDLSPLLQLACQSTSKIQTLNFLTAVSVVLLSLLLTLTSYIRIIMTIVAIPSTTGRLKAFSTCASHLTVVLIFFGSVAFVYVRPKASTDFKLNKLLSIFYIAVTPVINPLIYSFRNSDVKMAVRKVIARQILRSGSCSGV